MSKVLVVAPHPDDETLGCGGVLFRHKAEGDDIYWLIITGISQEGGWQEKVVKNAIMKLMQWQKNMSFLMYSICDYLQQKWIRYLYPI